MADGTATTAVTVRRGASADYERILDLGAEMAAEGWYAEAGLKWDRERAQSRGERYVANPAALLLVAEIDGKIVGFLMAHLAEYFAFDDHYSEEFLTYVAPEGRSSSAFIRLFAAWEQWARSRDCKELYFAPSIVGGPDDFLVLLRLGWSRRGVAWRKVLR